MKRRAWIAGAAALAMALAVFTGSGMASAQEDHSGAVKARQAYMQLNGFYMGQLAAVAKGQVPYDAAQATGIANSLLALASMGRGRDVAARVRQRQPGARRQDPGLARDLDHLPGGGRKGRRAEQGAGGDGGGGREPTSPAFRVPSAPSVPAAAAAIAASAPRSSDAGLFSYPSGAPRARLSPRPATRAGTRDRPGDRRRVAVGAPRGTAARPRRGAP